MASSWYSVSPNNDTRDDTGQERQLAPGAPGIPGRLHGASASHSPVDGLHPYDRNRFFRGNT